jgi:hypothetical protein
MNDVAAPRAWMTRICRVRPCVVVGTVELVDDARPGCGRVDDVAFDPICQAVDYVERCGAGVSGDRRGCSRQVRGRAGLR